MSKHLALPACLAIALLAPACGDNQTHPDPHAAYDAGAPTPLQCVPNLDGQIDSSELKAVLGVPVKYLVSPNGTTRTVDVVGTVDSSGKRVWDYGTDFATDQVAMIEASPLAGKWYAASFPQGQFVAPFDAGDTIEAVYSQDDAAIWLYGLASAQPSPPEGKTLLVYAQPIELYKLPLVVGSTWVSTGVITQATLRGQPYAGQDTYEMTDDATGELVLPDLTFSQAHRVRAKVTVAPAAGESVVTQQVSFLFECFGEVARVTSQNGETNPDFTVAAQERRFGLSPQ
jgi:hypothetical protein